MKRRFSKKAIKRMAWIRRHRYIPLIWCIKETKETQDLRESVLPKKKTLRKGKQLINIEAKKWQKYHIIYRRTNVLCNKKKRWTLFCRIIRYQQ